MVIFKESGPNTVGLRDREGGDGAPSACVDEVVECFRLPQLDCGSSWQQFSGSINTTVENMGFSDYQFTRIFSLEEQVRVPLTTLLELENVYESIGLGERDIIKEHAFRSTDVFFLSSFRDAAKQFPFSPDMKIAQTLVSLIENMGFCDSFTVPSPSFRGFGTSALTVFSRAASAKDFKTLAKRQEKDLIHLTDAISIIGSLRFPERFGKANPKPPARRKSIEALYWVSQGMPQKKVADIMHIAEVTVADHLRAARYALGAKSTSHAIRIGMAQGLIDTLVET